MRSFKVKEKLLHFCLAETFMYDNNEIYRVSINTHTSQKEDTTLHAIRKKDTRTYSTAKQTELNVTVKCDLF